MIILPSFLVIQPFVPENPTIAPKKTDTLREAKLKMREIKRYCESRPLPLAEDVNQYIDDNGLKEYRLYADYTSRAAWAASSILFSKRKNKSRD